MTGMEYYISASCCTAVSLVLAVPSIMQHIFILDGTKLAFNSLKYQLNIPKMSLKYIPSLATSFGHSGPSSGNTF
jgi:hypothetical protein